MGRVWRSHPRFETGSRAVAIGVAAVVMVAAWGPARAEPPILNPHDAFCRSEARAKVFAAPDPLNLGLREIGRQIWASCMQRGTAVRPAKAHRAPRHRGRERRKR